MAAQPNIDPYESMMNTIRHWSAARRLMLVQDVLKTLEASIAPRLTRQRTLDRALGIVQVAHPPTDAEVEQILDDYRQEKFGQ